AADIGVSESLLYKWTENPAGTDASGMVSPLARLAQILLAIPDADLANWICRHAGGFFVPNPPAPAGPSPVLQSIRTMVREFSELLDTVTESIENDGKIDEGEARRIRTSWEDLKRHMEQFSIACESGRYQRGR
ncbi:MAG: hypothetical protein HY608_10490, partial [Planctomycetes bacterium]|nr:hypothetical protein [Planctomycetota bacterium]